MRLVFLGNDPWSVPSLDALAGAGDMEVALVVTNPPRPSGRGSRLTPTAVASAARGLGLSLLEIERVGDAPGLVALRACAPDVLVVVAYGELLSTEVLSIPPLGAVNVHFSLLPRWRGASPVRHALLAGDETTGVTIMRIDASLDGGPVIATQAETVDPRDDAGTLGARLAEIGASLLVRTLPSYAAGRADPVPQPAEGVTTAPKLTPADRQIDWARTAVEITNRVRASSPNPGARTAFRGGPLNVLELGQVRIEAELAPERSRTVADPEPGTVVAVDTQGPIIATGSVPVRLLRVAPAGKRRMPGEDWARGARVAPGERFG